MGCAKIRADQAWGTTTGIGIVVANIDTGVEFDHPALVNQYLGNNGESFSHSTTWFDPSEICPNPAVPCDNNNHGSHTMGTMVGDDGGSNQIGVAPGANWIACKGCESNSCSSFALNSCADWVLNPGEGVPPHIVSNSWGGGSGNLWYDSKVQAWRNAGLFPAFSLGNSGPSCNTARSPGDNPNAFGVGATDINDIIAGFSSRGPSAFGEIKPDVSAPGRSVRSSIANSGYASFSGTSMASPHVAGTVALLWAADPTLVGNIALTEQILQDTAVPLTSSQSCGGVSGSAIPNNTYGWGRIDALAAVNWDGTPNTPPTVTITAPTSTGPFPCGSAVAFTATAIDPEDADISSSIIWTEDGSPLPLGTGGSMSKTYNCLGEVGIHTVHADATDLGGLSDNDFVSIEVYDPDAINAPSNLQATVNGEEVTCDWQDNSPNNTGFQLQFKKILKGKGKKNQTWGNVVPTAGENDETQVPTLTEGKYDLRLFAFNPTNTSDYSNVVRVTTTSGGGGGDPPPTPGACNSNEVCDPGEDCNSCASDCDGKSNGKPSGRFCCGDGVPDPAEGDGSICDGYV